LAEALVNTSANGYRSNLVFFGGELDRPFSMPQPTAIGNGLPKRIYDAHVKEGTPLTTPPHPGDWLKIELHPATSFAAKESSALRRA
jgi:hypothetical protein